MVTPAIEAFWSIIIVNETRLETEAQRESLMLIMHYWLKSPSESYEDYVLVLGEVSLLLCEDSRLFVNDSSLGNVSTLHQWRVHG